VYASCCDNLARYIFMSYEDKPLDDYLVAVAHNMHMHYALC